MPPLAVELEKVFEEPAVRQISALPFSMFATHCAPDLNEKRNTQLNNKQKNKSDLRTERVQIFALVYILIFIIRQLNRLSMVYDSFARRCRSRFKEKQRIQQQDLISKF